MKINVITVVKIVGVALSVAGTLATGWAGKQENNKMLEKLVNDRLENQ